ncbi:MAG TPA: hypothetical protein ACHBX0_13885 [Arsenophonus sp.]
MSQSVLAVFVVLIRLVRQFILIQQSRVLLILIYRRQVVVAPVVIPRPHRE